MKTTTWIRNFRRWSTQMFTAMAVLGAYQGTPEMLAHLTDSLALWQPLLSPGQFAFAQTLLGVAGIYLRNLAQRDAD